MICLRFLILYFLFWPTKFRLLLKGSPGSSSAYFSQLEKNVDLRFFFKSVFQIFRKLYRNNRNEFRLTHFLKLSIEIFWIGLSHPLIEKNHSREKFRNYSSNKNRGPPDSIGSKEVDKVDIWHQIGRFFFSKIMPSDFGSFSDSSSWADSFEEFSSDGLWEFPEFWLKELERLGIRRIGDFNKLEIYILKWVCEVKGQLQLGIFQTRGHLRSNFMVNT